MPGFIKTPKDEARWSKAKEAAGKQTAKDSESYWKLSNYIYHRMGKTEQDVADAQIAHENLSEDEKLSARNYSDNLVKHEHEQQSIRSNEVESMSETKKYTAKEAAVAVLKKTEELLAKSEVIKKAKLDKAEPKGEIHPKEPQAGESENPGERVHAQVAPDKNPKEQAEGNNELAGTTPTQVGQDGKNKPGFDEIRGHLKLAKFIGHMEAKRKMKPGAV